MTTKTPTPAVHIYQIKVTLRDSSPPIWRRLLLRSDTTLAQFHDILQVAMGWGNSHLHQFIVRGEYYGPRELSMGWGPPVKDENKVKLSRIVAGEKSKFDYDYDMGDSWTHTILVEKVLPVEEGKQYPICIKGKCACPPEDIGGIWGYYGFLEAIQDPKHPEHNDMVEWVGDEFDPAAFDIDAVNARLKKIR